MDVKPKVRQLKWDNFTANIFARAIRYEINLVMHEVYLTCYRECIHIIELDNEYLEHESTLERAKRAAQEHYENMILGELEE